MKRGEKRMPEWEYHRERFANEMLKYTQKQIAIADKLALASPIEAIMHLELLKLHDFFSPTECKVESQLLVGEYIVDFLVTYHNPKTNQDYCIVVECDGYENHYSTKEQALKNIEMNRYFALQGYGMLRYLGTEVCSKSSQGTKDAIALIHMNRGWE